MQSRISFLLFQDFAEGKETKYQGAARGTAYHRVMECLDYGKTVDFREIQNQIRDMEEQKKLIPRKRHVFI